jgi:plastocyanin
MKRTGTIVGAVILIVLLAGAAFALTRKSNSTDNSTQPSTSQTETTTETTDQSVAAAITYDGSSFSPDKITVKSGDKITVKNTSSITVEFDSDPHPVHSDNTELNIGIISPGNSMTFTVDKTGTWSYHNHLDPGQTGTIVVQ